MYKKVRGERFVFSNRSHNEETVYRNTRTCTLSVTICLILRQGRVSSRPGKIERHTQTFPDPQTVGGDWNRNSFPMFSDGRAPGML